MKYSKISLNKLSAVVRAFNNQGFNYPDSYKLSFPVFQFCRYCKRPFLTKKIHVFESNEAGKIICSCPKCGGRHIITIKILEETKKAYKVIAICLALLIIFIPLMF